MILFSGNREMKLSTERILTTHVGSLPRPNGLFELMLARMDGKPVDDKSPSGKFRFMTRHLQRAA
jgi:5-methyltetrahydropteroyltriglutamate--homocysteine methyltransferase